MVTVRVDNSGHAIRLFRGLGFEDYTMRRPMRVICAVYVAIFGPPTAISLKSFPAFKRILLERGCSSGIRS